MSGESVRYLSRADVEAVGLSGIEVIEILDAAFRAKRAGDVEMPPKIGVHPRDDAFIHAMPAYLSSSDAVGLKWVAGYPGNPARGLPYVSGLLILNDVETGLPSSVMDCTWIPFASATKLWANSWRTIDPKKRRLVATPRM